MTNFASGLSLLYDAVRCLSMGDTLLILVLFWSGRWFHSTNYRDAVVSLYRGTWCASHLGPLLRLARNSHSSQKLAVSLATVYGFSNSNKAAVLLISRSCTLRQSGLLMHFFVTLVEWLMMTFTTIVLEWEMNGTVEGLPRYLLSTLLKGVLGSWVVYLVLGKLACKYDSRRGLRQGGDVLEEAVPAGVRGSKVEKGYTTQEEDGEEEEEEEQSAAKFIWECCQDSNLVGTSSAVNHSSQDSKVVKRSWVPSCGHHVLLSSSGSASGTEWGQGPGHKGEELEPWPCADVAVLQHPAQHAVADMENFVDADIRTWEDDGAIAEQEPPTGLQHDANIPELESQNTGEQHNPRRLVRRNVRVDIESLRQQLGSTSSGPSPVKTSLYMSSLAHPHFVSIKSVSRSLDYSTAASHLRSIFEDKLAGDHMLGQVITFPGCVELISYCTLVDPTRCSLLPRAISPSGEPLVDQLLEGHDNLVKLLNMVLASLMKVEGVDDCYGHVGDFLLHQRPVWEECRLTLGSVNAVDLEGNIKGRETDSSRAGSRNRHGKSTVTADELNDVGPPTVSLYCPSGPSRSALLANVDLDEVVSSLPRAVPCPTAFSSPQRSGPTLPSERQGPSGGWWVDPAAVAVERMVDEMPLLTRVVSDEGWGGGRGSVQQWQEIISDPSREEEAPAIVGSVVAEGPATYSVVIRSMMLVGSSDLARVHIIIQQDHEILVDTWSDVDQELGAVRVEVPRVHETSVVIMHVLADVEQKSRRLVSLPLVMAHPDVAIELVNVFKTMLTDYRAESACSSATWNTITMSRNLPGYSAAGSLSASLMEDTIGTYGLVYQKHYSPFVFDLQLTLRLAAGNGPSSHFPDFSGVPPDTPQLLQMCADMMLGFLSRNHMDQTTMWLVRVLVNASRRFGWHLVIPGVEVEEEEADAEEWEEAPSISDDVADAECIECDEELDLSAVAGCPYTRPLPEAAGTSVSSSEAWPVEGRLWDEGNLPSSSQRASLVPEEGQGDGDNRDSVAEALCTTGTWSRLRRLSLAILPTGLRTEFPTGGLPGTNRWLVPWTGFPSGLRERRYREYKGDLFCMVDVVCAILVLPIIWLCSPLQLSVGLCCAPCLNVHWTCICTAVARCAQCLTRIVGYKCIRKHRSLMRSICHIFYYGVVVVHWSTFVGEHGHPTVCSRLYNVFLSSMAPLCMQVPLYAQVRIASLILPCEIVGLRLRFQSMAPVVLSLERWMLAVGVGYLVDVWCRQRFRQRQLQSEMERGRKGRCHED